MASEVKINSKRVAIVSDIHGGVHRNSQAWYNVLTEWCAWFKQQCLDNNIKDIIIPGDIFHHRNEVNVHCMNIVYDMFEALECFNIIVIVGNHDAYYKNTSEIHSLVFLKKWENVSVIDEVTTITAFDSTITLCPWGTSIDDIPKSDIVFGHFELVGFNMATHKICTHGISSRDILSKGDLVITGHFHLREERKYNDGVIVYVGSAYEQTWGDAGSSKGMYILDVASQDYEFIENNVSPKHKKILLSNIISKSVDLKTELKDNWIKIVIDKKISNESIDMLITKLNAFQPLSLHVEYEYETDISENVEYEFEGVEVGECIREYVDLLEIDNKQDVVEHMLDLYRRVG